MKKMVIKTNWIGGVFSMEAFVIPTSMIYTGWVSTSSSQHKTLRMICKI